MPVADTVQLNAGKVPMENLLDLKVGEYAYVRPLAMWLTGSVYRLATATIISRTEEGDKNMRVSRNADGYYVTVPTGFEFVIQSYRDTTETGGYVTIPTENVVYEQFLSSTDDIAA